MLVPTKDSAPEITPQNDLMAALTQGMALISDEPPAPAPSPGDTPPPATEPAAPAPEPAAPEPEATIDPADPLASLEKSDKPEVGKLPIEDLKTDPTDDIKPGDKAGYRIKELKEEIATKWKPLEQTLAQKEARIAELESKSAQLDELQQKLQSYETEMSVVKLERTEAYQKQVAEPMKNVIESAVRLADQHGIDKDELLDALEVTDYEAAKRKIVQLTSGLDVPPVDLLEMVSLHGKVQPILSKREELYANADKALSELQARSEQENLQKRAQIAEERVRTAPVVLEKVAAHIPALAEFVKTHGDAIAKTDIDSLDLANRIYNHTAGLAVPVLAKKLASTQQQLDDALDEIGKLRKAAPSPGATRFTPHSGTERPTDLLKLLNQQLGDA